MTGTAMNTQAILDANPQAILNAPKNVGIFLVLAINPGDEASVHDFLGDLSSIIRSVSFRVDGALSCVAGIGSKAWDRLFAGPRPALLHELPVYAGQKHQSVTTPGDLLFHIRAHTHDVCFELAAQILRRLAEFVTVLDETHGFKYFDERDLMGFVDGTENPSGNESLEMAFISSDDPAFTGSSYVIVQKYRHDLKSWNSLKTEQQEDAIGRTKLSDMEYSDDAKPANAHTVLTTIVDKSGVQQKIIRCNMPFGSVSDGDNGTYFIAYGRDPAITEQMLHNMFIGKPAGNHDRILDFSTAVTGTLFFVPTADFLDDPPVMPSMQSSST